MKPIFHKKTIMNALKSVQLPADFDAKRAIIDRWIAALKTGALDIIKEISLHGDFLHDIFGEILGYRSVIQGEGKEWTLHAEAHISDGGGSADAALGFFSAAETKRGAMNLNGRIVAPIELKGATNDLDRAASGRKESAVEQGWRYANYTEGCRWIIVSNYREIRLYRTSKTPAFRERFLLEELANPEHFKRFYLLLGSSNLLPAEKRIESNAPIDHLLRDSDNAEEEITKALYTEYKDTRRKLVQWLQENGPRNLEAGVLIEAAQKILDRILFIAFCEDRGLLPPDTIKKAHDYKDPYSSVSIWTRYKAVFRWVDKGNEEPRFHAYNGGLYKYDPIIDERIDLPDALCAELSALTRYDYNTDVSVEVLGHIFEQSVTDLEEIKAVTAGKSYNKKKGKRKTQGVFYTPAFITRYIVDLALGGHLRRKEEELRRRIGLDSIPEAHSQKLQKAERLFWEAYRDDVLKKTRVLDPACGSGAFLIAAFDFLLSEYERVNSALTTIKKGQRGLFDLNKTILKNNLYGVDLSKESVEITKLSLWLKTAERGKKLTFLDDNIRQGDSIVADQELTPDAFDWHSQFPGVFTDGGFNVIIGNPPYVRQELLGSVKPHLEKHYESYDSLADLYTYFYELGVRVLSTGGVLSFIVTNKWLKAGYGEALRKFFARHTRFEQIVDFGHAPIFKDADVFPCIVSIIKTEEKESGRKRKPPVDPPVVVCSVPREKLPDINLNQYVQQHGHHVPWSRFTGKPWSLEHPAVDDLMMKIREAGQPLSDYLGAKPSYGIKTGFNKAFLIDDSTRAEILKKDPKSQQLIKPLLRGQDIKRWRAEWRNIWIILLKSSNDFQWPWHGFPDPEAEQILKSNYPGIFEHLQKSEASLKKRRDQGTYWWELRSCAYYDLFESPKLLHTDIAWRPQFSFSKSAVYLLNTAYVWPTDDLYLLA
ncbi:MAG: N-6 DNA methylase, partial [Proteobacteria bacterium]|nr:N-6 DNA methylase [Pseudomonadota bacterium]